MVEQYSFLGLPQSQWQFINTFADWLSAIGTLAAVIITLRLAYYAATPKGDAYTALYDTFGGIGGRGEHYGISLVNTGDRPITVVAVGWRLGVFNWRWRILRKRQGIQMTYARDIVSTTIPITLTHGQKANWYINATQVGDDGDTWGESFGRRMLLPYLSSSLWSLRASIHTSTGHTFYAKPTTEMLERLRAEALAAKSRPLPPE